MTKQHKALELADSSHLAYRVGWRLQAAAELRRQHALIARLVKHADPDATECEHCAGDGWHWKECQVAERATDVQPLKTHCDACGGIGFVGPDSEFKAALAAANEYLEQS